MRQQMCSFLWHVRSHQARFILSLILGKNASTVFTIRMHSNSQKCICFLPLLLSFSAPLSTGWSPTSLWCDKWSVSVTLAPVFVFLLFLVAICARGWTAIASVSVWVCAVFALLQRFFSTLIFNASRVASGKTRWCSGGVTVGKIKIRILSFIVTCQRR